MTGVVTSGAKSEHKLGSFQGLRLNLELAFTEKESSLRHNAYEV
ncbi:hypothetical protein M8C21_027947 [Ambrosia artemisiifolia]|uniref:Uncharacterized protein n=1 Tax=Ambrosia artemisiifolia TaxID=4212 RepID=A0AAD5GJB8_AMBAR|nr:hypothetical protein M8C21_027947 [Ambrosia artemisiifolia]